MGIKHIKPTNIIIWGYIAVILVGALCLMLPIATRNNTVTPFLNALFTSTSATCVTGLVIYDTYTYWSPFGQFIILALIQIGGLGFMTIAISIMGFTKHKIGLSERYTMQESIAAPHIGGIVRLGRFILIIALLLEVLGAIFLALRFCPMYGWVKGLYYSFFHSVSAFCNAGFDLMGTEAPFSSFTSVSGDILINTVVILLIVLGGLGFAVWEDVWHHKLDFKRYRVHTKIVLVATALLITVGAVFLFVFEQDGQIFAGKSLGEQIVISIFHSITPRTAGFNTVNISELKDTSILLTIILMFIGGSPGSTAGGIKTTTFMMLVLSVFSVIKKRKTVECFKRRVEDKILKNAIAIFSIYILLIMVASFFIAHMDHISVKAALFEVTSAIGTVGLSFGITSSLGPASHCALMLLMYFGRVGCLTVLYNFSKRFIENANIYPEEKVVVG